MPQLSYPLDDTLYTAADAQIWLSTRTQGVFSSNNDLVVTPVTAMTVTMSPGVAWLKPSRFVNAVYANTAALQFIVDTADGMFTRIDRLVIRWDFVASPNRIYATIKKGTPGSNPSAPALQRNAEAHEISPFDIRVRPGVLQITAADIIDNRANETLCGIMRDGVTQIPTQALYDAWWSWFSSLKDDVERWQEDFQQNSEQWFNGLKNTTENKAAEFAAWMNLFRSQNESELAEWLANFKTNSQGDFNAWFDGFRDANSTIFDNWYNSFTSSRGDNFDAWFADLQATLDADVAGNLFNKIDNHERTGISDSDDGVHNLRLKNGKLQVFVGTGWATLVSVPFGFTGALFNAQSFTGRSFNMSRFTGHSFNNVIRTEVD